MKDSIHKYFQMGTIQWMSHPPVNYEILDSIKQISCDDFFDAIEITQFKDEEKRIKAKAILERGTYESLLWSTAKAVRTRT